MDRTSPEVAVVVAEDAVVDCGAGVPAINRSGRRFHTWGDRFIRGVSICNREAIQNGIRTFAAVKAKTSMRIGGCAVAVDDCLGNDVWVVWVGGGYRDCLSKKVYVRVSGSGVYAGSDPDDVAVVCIVYCGLDGGEVGGAVVSDGDDSGGTRA